MHYAEIEGVMQEYGCRVKVGMWEAQGVNARVGRGRLEVTSGFLEAPDGLQRAILAHEAGHVQGHHGVALAAAVVAWVAVAIGAALVSPAWARPAVECVEVVATCGVIGWAMRWQERCADAWAARHCPGFREGLAAVQDPSPEKGWRRAVEALGGGHPLVERRVGALRGGVQSTDR